MTTAPDSDQPNANQPDTAAESADTNHEIQPTFLDLDKLSPSGANAGDLGHRETRKGSNRSTSKRRTQPKWLSQVIRQQNEMLAAIRPVVQQYSTFSRSLAELARWQSTTEHLGRAISEIERLTRIPQPVFAVDIIRSMQWAGANCFLEREVATAADLCAHQFAAQIEAHSFLQSTAIMPVLGSTFESTLETTRLGHLIWREHQAIQRFISPSSLITQLTSTLENREFFSSIAPISRDPFMKFARAETKEPHPVIRRYPQRESQPSQVSDIKWEALRYLDYLVQQQIEELGITKEECIQRVFCWISTQASDSADAQEAEESIPSPSRGQTTKPPVGFRPEDVDQYCSAVCSDGIKEYSRSEFELNLRSALDKYDLVVDGLAHRVYRRLHDGRMRNVRISPRELALLVHAMRTRECFRPNRVIDCASRDSAERQFYEARKKADLHALKPDGGECRRRFVAFEANRADKESPLIVRFNPPAGFKWILLVRYED